MSPFDSHPFLWIALLIEVLILLFVVLRLLFKSQHRKVAKFSYGADHYDVTHVCHLQLMPAY